MAIKKSQTTSNKSSAKKNITGKSAKPAKKTEIKKTPGNMKQPAKKLSRPKTVAKPPIKPVMKSGIEIKKSVNATEVKEAKKEKVKSPDKKSVEITAKRKPHSKKPLTLKKSQVKIVNAKTRVTQQKTVAPAGTKKTAAPKVDKIVTGKAEIKTAKKINTPAKTVGAATKEKKSTAKKAGPEITPAKKIKPLSSPARKVSNAAAEIKTAKKIETPAKTAGSATKEKKSTVKTSLPRKSAISSTTQQIKETPRQKTVLKPEGKKETPLSTTKKTASKKGTSSLITEEPLRAISKKPTTPATASQSQTIIKRTANLKVFLPDEELPPAPAKTQRVTPVQLPEEYGENELLLMEVDPSIVFVSWEIKPDDISAEAGKLTLRVFDVTGLDFNVSHSNSFFDIPLRKRVDSKFIDIRMPGKDVIMEVGLLDSKGTFKTIKRSNRVSMPDMKTFEELGITGLSDSETLIGY